MTHLTSPRLLVCLAACLAPGCSCDAAALPDQDGGGDGMVDGPGSVTGSDITTHISAAGETEVPVDLSGVAVEALVFEDGAYRRIAGRGAADGTWVIDDVPAGEYLLRVGTTYLLTAARDVDLGGDRLGRPGGVEAGQPITVTLDLHDMTAWQDGDTLDLFVPNSSAATFGLDSALEPPPVADDQAIAATFDFTAEAFPSTLIDASDGDDPVFAHRGTQIDNLEEYQTVTEIFEPGALAMTDGEPLSVSGSFAPVALDRSVDVNILGSAWEALLPAITVGTPLSTAAPSVSVFGMPYSGDRGDLSPFELASYTAPDFDDHSLTVSYGRWLPGGVESVSVSMFLVQTLDADTNTIGFGLVGIAGADLAAQANPLLGPVGAPRIDGADMTVARTIATTTPEIAWSAPAIGSADAYTLILFEATGLTGTRVASFTTTRTSLVLPGGLLEPGRSYYARIGAHDADIDYQAAPFRRSTLRDNSSLVPTALFAVE